MDKLINDINWHVVSSFFGFIITVLTPIVVIIIKPWRDFFNNFPKAVKFFLELMNPEHKMYYKGFVDKTDELYENHKEQNSSEVKHLKAIIEGYEAEKKAKEKEGFEKLQASFENLDSKVENALDQLVDHKAQVEQNKTEVRELYKIVTDQGKILQKLDDNYNRRAA